MAPPDMVKIDVEGAEMEVLRGLEQSIRAYKPILLYEVDDQDPKLFLKRQAELDTFVISLGYVVSHLESSYPRDGSWVGHSLAVPEREAESDAETG
jgi:hypothetical protein